MIDLYEKKKNLNTQYLHLNTSTELSSPDKIQDFYNLFLKENQTPNHKALKFFLDRDDLEK